MCVCVSVCVCARACVRVVSVCEHLLLLCLNDKGSIGGLLRVDPSKAACGVALLGCQRQRAGVPHCARVRMGSIAKGCGVAGVFCLVPG